MIGKGYFGQSKRGVQRMFVTRISCWAVFNLGIGRDRNNRRLASQRPTVARPSNHW